MSAGKLLLFGSLIFRKHKPVYPILPINFVKPFPSSVLSLRRYSSSAAVDGLSDTGESLVSHHPWPEWVAFVDLLKSKGYYVEASVPQGDTEGESTIGDIYRDINLLKIPSFSFARDRFDIFKSLSRKDIQRIVEKGCPNLFRKAVNSAKRLRAYVQLDEGDVCSVCKLRGSCDRSYVILKESEAAARTVDIVRLLLFYALDPLVISGEERPPDRDYIEISARQLLSQLTQLSETSPNPSLPKPVTKSPQKKEKTSDLLDDNLTQNVEMKRGDWICTKCDFMNFSRNTRCMKCNEDGPRTVSMDDIEMKKGDWTCPECNFMNFSRNLRCLKCKTEGPKRVSPNEVEMKKGDWNCPQCGFMNFASNGKCLRCREPRKRQLNPGEWECPSCDFLNYRRNMVCLKCNCERPKDAAKRYEEQIWKRPQHG